MEPILEARGIRKEYKVADKSIAVLDSVDISVGASEFLAVVGASGTGKSTLLYVLSGLEPPERGTVLLDGANIYTMSDDRRSHLRASTFGFIFQSFNLVSTMTAVENVAVPLHLTGEKRPVERAKEMLERVGLAQRIHHKPGQLSGGEQQRVAIARALALNPRIIFADEPTGNLDYKTSQEVMGMIHSLVRDRQAACLLVTHNREWAEMADRVVNLQTDLRGTHE